MTSPARFSANRANARRSTGPRTKQGKATSSRNAVRHGLNTAAPDGSAGLDELARRLGDAVDAGEDTIATAAEAQDYLVRIQTIKHQVLQSTILNLSNTQAGPEPTAPFDVMTAALLSCEPQLRLLDDYERKARSRRKKAFRALEP